MNRQHVEPFRAEHSEPLLVVMQPVEQFPEVQELLVNPEGTCWDTVSVEG